MTEETSDERTHWRPVEGDTVTVAEAAQIADMTPQGIRDLINRGRLPSATSHGVTVLHRLTVERWAADRANRPRRGPAPANR